MYSMGLQFNLFSFSFYSRLIETDAKSLNSLQSGHSRRSSDTSQISVTSGCSFQEAMAQQLGAAIGGMHLVQREGSIGEASDNSGGSSSSEEDLWTLWGKIIKEGDSGKKKLPHIKVR